MLDVVDVVLSKLKRWSALDREDVRTMVERNHVEREVLVTRFRSLVEAMKFDARADLLEKMAERINEIEEDWFGVEPTDFEFDPEIFR